MMDLELQSLLRRGTKMYQSRRGDSTIDLILTTQALAAERVTRQRTIPNMYPAMLLSALY
jgi:hypothetical protein